MVGAVKETGVADTEVTIFHDDYFGRNVIYKDDQWKIFQAMGERKIRIIPMVFGLFAAQKRWRQKKIQMYKKSSGDVMTKGGILIFNKRGVLTHFYDEPSFEEIDMDLLAVAVEDCRRMTGDH